MPLNAKYRQSIINRDGRKCVKCNSHLELHVHHIKMVADDGDDSAENLTTLCGACHLEWHLVEQINNLSFQDWLKTPTYNCFLAWFYSLKQSDISKLSGVQALSLLDNCFEYIKLDREYESMKHSNNKNEADFERARFKNRGVLSA